MAMQMQSLRITLQAQNNSQAMKPNLSINMGRLTCFKKVDTAT